MCQREYLLTTKYSVDNTKMDENCFDTIPVWRKFQLITKELHKLAGVTRICLVTELIHCYHVNEYHRVIAPIMTYTISSCQSYIDNLIERN